MKHALISAALLTLLGANESFAYFCADGQQPVPPEIAARMALPLCGFAATHRWGPNGCQLCDARNMYPNPFAADSAPVRRAHHVRSRKY